MAADLGTSLAALALLLALPSLLLLMLWVLGWLEGWMLRPYERAVEIERLLAQVDEVEAVERGVIRVVADVADSPGGRTARRPLAGSSR